MATPVEAPMVGKILQVLVKVGDQVAEDDTVVVMEAMKMEINVVAPTDGRIAEVNVAAGRLRRHRSGPGDDRMTDVWAIGYALAILGMGGTFVTLAIISGLIVLLKRVFPYVPEDAK